MYCELFESATAGCCWPDVMILLLRWLVLVLNVCCGGGLNGCTSLSPVMNGCSFACCGVHRSAGSMMSRPEMKSMKEALFAVSFC